MSVACVPDGSELRALVVVGTEVRDEGEVRDLRGGPAELEDHHEGRVVHELGPLPAVLALDARQEDEGETAQHTQGTWKLENIEIRMSFSNGRSIECQYLCQN